MIAELKQNPLVDFLRSYGPLPSSNAQFDEHVQSTAKRKNVRPLHVTAAKKDALEKAWASSDRPSVVLTGTAGDGKTYTCRRALEDAGADMTAWATEKVLDLELPGKGPVKVVKDLAELTDEEKVEVYDAFAASVTGVAGAIPLVVASNDGQLVAFVRQFADRHPAGPAIDEAIRKMLVEERESSDDLSLRLYNLSRQPHDALFGEVVDAIVKHPDWSRCDGCTLLVAGTCPIRRNLAILANSDDPSLRLRLSQLIRIAALNGTHLPVRQLLLLCSNILLGDGKSGGLIRCVDAHVIAQKDDAAARVNPYRNVSGLNFEPTERRQFRAFTVFDSFGLGRETLNAFDEMMLEREPADAFEKFMAADLQFGDSLLSKTRAQYRAAPTDVDMPALHDALADQRRRLFFTLPEEKGRLDPWLLTIFTGGGDYLRFATALDEDSDATKVKRHLMIGLNRVYTGLMTDDDDKLWLTGPAGNTQSRQGRVLDTAAPIRLGRSAQERLSVDFDAKGLNGRPRLTLSSDDEVVNFIDLTPLLFEYLIRIKDGSLPSSFSRQCLEELRQFRLRSVARLAAAGLIPPDPHEVTLVRLPQSGRLAMTALPLGVA